MLTYQKCDVLPDLPNQCKIILDHSRGDMDMLNKALAVKVSDDLLEYHSPQKNLKEPPQLLVSYRLMSVQDQMDYDRKYPDWRRRSGADVWIEYDEAIIRENESNLMWLKRYEEYLKDDKLRQEKIKSKISEYSFPKDLPKEIRKVADMFNAQEARAYKDDGWGEEN